MFIISLLVILCLVLAVISVFSIILIRTLLVKISIYEQWIIDLRDSVNDTISDMRKIDKDGTFSTSLNDKGNFESDDQVGRIFKELLIIVEDLDNKVQ